MPNQRALVYGQKPSVTQTYYYEASAPRIANTFPKKTALKAKLHRGFF